MKKLFLLTLLCLSLSLTACPAKVVTPGDATTSISAFEVAQKSLYASGAALDAAKKTVDALFDTGKLSKADYNKITPVYNQALGSFQIAVAALNSAKAIKVDPTNYPAYTTALANFLGDKKNVDNLIAAFGGSK